MAEKLISLKNLSPQKGGLVKIGSRMVSANEKHVRRGGQAFIKYFELI